MVVFSTSPGKRAAVEALGAQFINSNDAADVAAITGLFSPPPPPFSPAQAGPLLCPLTCMGQRGEGVPATSTGQWLLVPASRQRAGLSRPTTRRLAARSSDAGGWHGPSCECVGGGHGGG